MILEGKTLKGKNRVREHGSEWTLLETRQRVLFSFDTGPWLHVQSLKTGDSRWVHGVSDRDFKVTP